MREDYSLTFPPSSIARVLIYTAEWTGASWIERKFPNFEMVAKGIRTRALSIASPAFYSRATALHDTYFIYLKKLLCIYIM